MAVKSKEEILNSIKERFVDDESDETLAFIEDITDTINDLESKTSDTTDWKSKYEENDKEWRKKYKDRFFATPDNGTEPKSVDEEIPINEDKHLTYDELFKKGE